MTMQFLVPLLIMIILFLLLNYTAIAKYFNNHFLLRIRILLACIFLGFLVYYTVLNPQTKTIILSTGLGCIIMLNVYRLQQKYFVVKD